MQKEAINPFVLYGYEGPEYFCDREEETAQLLSAFRNQRNVTLYSPRRYGKTGLIQHAFHQLDEEEGITIYIDIYGTTSRKEFIEVLGQAIVQAVEQDRDGFIHRVGRLFKRLRPKVTFDSLTGEPAIELDVQSKAEEEQTLRDLFAFLEEQPKRCWVAIDEFQQINNYPEKQVDGLLRSYIQHLSQVQFLFAGSQKHLLLPLFTDANRPFFQSTGFLHLEKLPAEAYGPFIMYQFNRHNKHLSQTALERILTFTRRHTYYTQYLCNRLFGKTATEATGEDVDAVIIEIFEEREPIFYNYRNLITPLQFKLLTAIAQEELLYHPTATDFIQRHQLNSAATVRKSLQSLIDKELVVEVFVEGKRAYQLNDVFLAQWLAWKYA